MNTYGLIAVNRSLANSGVRASGRRASVATSGFMIGAALGIAALLPVQATAATAEGTLITNVACATFSAVDQTPFAASYCSTAVVFIVAPSVQVNKRANPSIECSGGTVTFCMYAYNNSNWTSAFNVTLNDRLPDGVSYIPVQTIWAGGTAGAVVTQGYFRALSPFTIWGSEPPLGSVSGGPSDYYLRWSVNMLGPRQSAMFCYRVQIL